jgi:hypothetical protein
MTASAFDPRRAVTAGGGLIKPFAVRETRPLADALAEGPLSDDTPVLVVERGGAAVVLLTRQMSYYHVAQGELSGKAWGVFF